MRAWLGVLELELGWLGGGGEAPVLACRARVRRMRGALQGLAADHRQLCRDADDDLEAWRWLEVCERAMRTWFDALQHDLREAGTTPEGEDPRDDTRFTPDYGRAFDGLREAYRDWRYVSSNLAAIDSEVPKRDAGTIDLQCERIDQRARMRRAALKEMPKRDLRWGSAEARGVTFAS
jgi:hypothetical protein